MIVDFLEKNAILRHCREQENKISKSKNWILKKVGVEMNDVCKSWDEAVQGKIQVYPCEISPKFFMRPAYKNPMICLLNLLEKRVPVLITDELSKFFPNENQLIKFLDDCANENFIVYQTVQKKRNKFFEVYPTNKLKESALDSNYQTNNKQTGTWTQKEIFIFEFAKKRLKEAYVGEGSSAITSVAKTPSLLAEIRRVMKKYSIPDIEEVIENTIKIDGWWIVNRNIRTITAIFRKFEKLETSSIYEQKEKEWSLPSCLSSKTIKSFKNTFVYDLEMANKIMESLDKFPFQRKNKDSIIDVLEKASIFMSGIYKMSINIGSFDDDYTVVSFENIFSYYLEEIDKCKLIYNGDFLFEKMADCLRYVLEFDVVYFGKRIEECSNTRLNKPIVDGKQIEIWGKFKEVNPDYLIESFANFVNGKIDDWAKIIMKAYKSLSENNGYLIDDETGKKGFFNEFYKDEK